jgi:AcrR family transcriptional regulator
MFTKFLNLDSEKRDRILNAAMEEFAHKGYKNASTNEIVVSAGIAKGLLFHYFKNKKQLFLFLFDYSVELITNEIYEKCSLDEPDIFLRLRQIMLFKMGLL